MLETTLLSIQSRIFRRLQNYRQRFTTMKNRALTSLTFRPKQKTENRDELAANASRPIFIVGVGKS
jgi:hypothetical protein